jgi:hypothetical protein
VAVLGAIAFSIDAGRLADERRHCKAACDAAARAAAIEMLDMLSGNTKVTLTSMRQSALDFAAANGYAHDGTNTIVSVNMPPLQGEYKGLSGYVEVMITSKQTRAFSRIFGSDLLSIAARSVAAGTMAESKASVLVLDPKKNNALAIGKGTSVLQVAGDIVVNSKSKKSPLSIDKKGQIIAENVSLAGNLGKKEFKAISRGITGQLSTRAPPADDPLADLPAPTSSVTRKLSDYKTIVNGVEHYQLQPGRYTEPLKFDHDDVVTLQPGVYELDGKGMQVKGNASITGTEVMIYSGGKNDLRFETKGEISLTPPSSGTYAGIAIFQDRNARGKISFQKDTDLNIQGTIYAPNSLVRFQKVSADLGGYDEGDDSAWDDLEADLEDAFSGDEDSSTGSLGASIVSRMLKIDKHSLVQIRAANLRVNRPMLEIVE